MPPLMGTLATQIGCALAFLGRWVPEEQRVSLRVSEGERGFYGSTVSGTMVHRVAPEHRPTRWPPGAPRDAVLIRLDQPWRYTHRTTTDTHYVIAETRFVGDRLCRLILTPVTVHVFPSFGSPPYVTMWKDLIAICDMTQRGEAALGDSIMVETDLFEHREVKPHFINPCCFGEDFVGWLKQELSQSPGLVLDLSEPIQEDYGWGFWASPTQGKDRCWVALSYVGDGPQEPPAQWIISVTVDPGLHLAKRLFQKLDQSFLPRLRDCMRQILASNESIHMVLPANKPT